MGSHIFADMQFFWGVLAAVLLFLLLAIFITLFVTRLVKSRQKHIRQMAELRYSYEQALLKSQLEIQEDTLKHISQEIHDNIGQVLSLAKLHLNMLTADQPVENQEAIVQTRKLVGKAISDLRSLSKSLHSDRVNELGLEENIRQELDVLGKTRQYETELVKTGTVYKIPVQTQTILFRMVQEAISNVIKHAAATRIRVLMEYTPERFSLSITDNGLGIQPHAATESNKGIGLRNMQNRSAIIGARFSISPNKDGGTCVQVLLPASAETSLVPV